jgi:hypothetical protein
MTYIAKKQYKKSAILTGKTDKRFLILNAKSAKTQRREEKLKKMM